MTSRARRCQCFAARRLAVVLLATLAMASSLVDAQSDEFLRYRVGVVEFNVIDLTNGGVVPSGLGAAMAAAFEAPLGQSRRFVVITRLNIGEVLDEQALGPTGILNPDQAQTFGAINGLNIIITGNITVFSSASYSISASFIDAATGELVDTATFRVSSPEEFFSAAEYFVDGAMIRFPLRGTVFAVDLDGTVFINVGIVHGLTPNEETGVIFRPREIAGRSIPLRIGTFTIDQIYQDATAIVPSLEGNFTVEVGDLVTIQPLAGADAIDTAPSQPEAITETSRDPSTESAADPTTEQAQDHSASPPSSTSTAYFDIDPPGAELFIDGDAVEGWVAEVAPGTHSFHVQAAGHEPFEGTFDASPDRVALVSVELTPLPARLAFLGESEDYSVAVDGRDVGSVRELELPPGTHEVVVSVPGLSTLTQSVTLGPGETAGITIPFEEPASLSISAPIGTAVVAVPVSGEAVSVPMLTMPQQSVELPAGVYLVTLIAPREMWGRDDRPRTQEFSVTLEPGASTDVSAHAYLSFEQLARGIVLRIWSGEELIWTLEADGPSGYLEVSPGLVRVELVQEAAVTQIASLALEPWELAQIAVPLVAPTLGDTPRAEPEAPAVALPSTEGVPPLQDTNAPTGEGGLTISSNAGDTFVVLDGPVTVTVSVGTEPVDVSLPDGFYLVTATAAGLAPFESVAFVSAGEMNDLAIRFDVGTFAVGVGTYRTDSSLDTLILLEGGESITGQKLEVRGPPGWNGDAEATLDVNPAAHFHVIHGVPPVIGDYTVRVVAGNGQVGEHMVHVTVYSVADQLRSATGLTLEPSTGGTAWARWSPVPGATMYLVELASGGAPTRLINSSSQVRVPASVLRQVSSLPWCVIALNWNPQASGPLSVGVAPQAVETCTVSSMERATRTSSSSDDSPPVVEDPGSEDPDEPTDSWKPDPKDVDP